MSTILHFPPAYCFSARIPLWAGTVFGAITGRNSAPQKHFFKQPNITDAGLYAVILAQHALLLATFICLVVCLASSAPLRFLLALILALQEPLYVYAQTIGSETLSCILTLAFLCLAWRLVLQPPSTLRPILWVGAALLLFLLISTRHVNTLLCGVLPSYYFLLLLGQLGRRLLQKDAAPSFAWRPFVASLLVGVAALVMAQTTTAILCHATATAIRSRLGYTFEWRLVKFSRLPPETKQTVWAGILPGLSAAPELSQLLTTEIIPHDEALTAPGTLARLLAESLQRSHPRLSADDAALQADQQLNLLAKVFILHSGPPYWQIVWHDWAEGFHWTGADLAREPFRTTDYFLKFPTAKSSLTILALPSFARLQRLGGWAAYDANPYLHWIPAFLPLWFYLALDLLLIAALFFARRPEQFAAALLMIAALGVSLVLWWSTKMLTDQAPRFVLPLYCATLFSLLLGLAAAGRSYFAGGVSSSARVKNA